MNCSADTAILPKFVGFPSLRGLISSTVQLRRTPMGTGRTPVRWSSHTDVGAGRTEAGPVPGTGPAPRGCDSPCSGSSAAPCQLPPPPHPPPPPPQDEDPPPHDEPPPQEEEPPPHDDPLSPPPAHQLPPLLCELPLRLWVRRDDRAPLRAADTRITTKTSATSATTNPVTMASASFRSPEADPGVPPWAPPARCVAMRCPPVSRPKAELSNFRGFPPGNAPDLCGSLRAMRGSNRYVRGPLQGNVPHSNGARL